MNTAKQQEAQQFSKTGDDGVGDGGELGGGDDNGDSIGEAGNIGDDVDDNDIGDVCVDSEGDMDDVDGNGDSVGDNDDGGDINVGNDSDGDSVGGDDNNHGDNIDIGSDGVDVSNDIVGDSCGDFYDINDDGDTHKDVVLCNINNLQQTLTCLIRLRYAIERMSSKGLFPYPVTPLVKLMKYIEILYEGEI